MNKKKRYFANPESIRSIKEQLILKIFNPEKHPLTSEERNLASCQAQWQNIAGRLAAYSQPIKIVHAQLYIKASSPVFVQELSFKKKEFLETIRKILNSEEAITDIKISIK